MVMVNVLASNGLSQYASVSSWYIEELLKLAIEQQVYMSSSPEFFTSKVRDGASSMKVPVHVHSCACRSNDLNTL